MAFNGQDMYLHLPLCGVTLSRHERAHFHSLFAGIGRKKGKKAKSFNEGTFGFREVAPRTLTT